MDHPIDKFLAEHVTQSAYDAGQNAIRNAPALKEEIERAFDGKIVLSDAEYNQRLTGYFAEMIMSSQNLVDKQ